MNAIEISWDGQKLGTVVAEGSGLVYHGNEQALRSLMSSWSSLSPEEALCRAVRSMRGRLWAEEVSGQS